MAKQKYTAFECGIRGEIPWWNTNGHKMVLNKEVTITGQVIIDDNAAALTITQFSTGWDVKWDVLHGFRKNFHGQVHLNTDELKAAFGISDRCKSNNQKAAKRYGVELLVPETFIRTEDILSIPGPSVKGTLISPAISLHLTDDIVEAVKQMIQECKPTIGK